MIVEIIKDDPRCGLKVGDQFEAIRYWLDPQEKVTLLRRISDGWVPDCNEYIHNVKFVQPTKTAQ